MDDHRFDAFARSLGTARSRRGALGLLAGAAGLAVADAEAKQRRKGRKGKPAKPTAASAACLAAGSKSCTLAQAKPGAVLKDCDYAGANLHGAALNAANLSKASLAGADLHGANLAGANLANACLTGADLSGASLRGASLSGADLTGANLCGANLRGSNVKPAQLATATLCCSTILPDNKPAQCPAGTTCVDGACVNRQGTCPTGANTCSGYTDSCNNNVLCNCLVSTEGETRCAYNMKIDGQNVCGQCRSSAECEAAYPNIPGVFCVRTTGTGCCGGDSAGFCLGPCPTA